MYARPATLNEALHLLAEPDARVLAGGTDLFPAAGERPLQGRIVDIGRLAELRGVTQDETHIRIGAATTWHDLEQASLPAAFDALRAAARDVGGLQIQNRGTIAGNLCNASPAADGAPPLLILDAAVELVSRRTTRLVPLDAFLIGNRRTLREPDELVSAIVVRRDKARGRSSFAKLGARRYLVISIVMTAVLLDIGADGRIGTVRVAVGACSAAARRLGAVEAALTGQAARPGLCETLGPDCFAGLAPIDDMRASAAYRAAVARTLVGRAFDACLRGEAGGSL